MNHSEKIRLLCRVGGSRLTTAKQSTTYNVQEYKEGIEKAFGVDVSGDDPAVHPTLFCSTCKKTMDRAIQNPKFVHHNGGCNPIPFVWRHHDVGDDTPCNICHHEHRGRPPKKKRRTLPPKRTADTKSSDKQSTSTACTTQQHTTSHIPRTRSQQESNPVTSSNGHDITLAQLKSVATPSHKAEKPLLPERFLVNFTSLICSVCGNIADSAVQAVCCQSNYCTDCIWERLGTNAECPDCKCELRASQLKETTASRFLADNIIHCDNYVDALNGCTAVIPLSELRLHTKSCTNKSKHVVMPSTPVAAILTASPSKLQGDTCQKITKHLMRGQSVRGVLELHSGRGPPETWTKTPVAKVASDCASARTIRRRSASLSQIHDKASGSIAGAIVQHAAALGRMKQHERQAVLVEAGVLPKTPGAGSALALKSDLHLPWNKVRKLRVWLKDFGLQLESERTMRHQLKSLLPLHITAENVPFSTPSGAVDLQPMVAIPNLVSTVHLYLDQLDSENQLTWHDGAIPDKQIWVKIGGDHGGDSFKMSCQILNVPHPNALRHVIPFLVFGAKDTASNLTTALTPFVGEMENLAATPWRGKAVKVMLFGDYAFQTTIYGLSGSSGLHPCLHCKISRVDMQSPEPVAEQRSLQSLRSDNAQYCSAGAKLADAKKFFNSIRPPLLPIDVTDVIIPVLHLNLGIFQWIFDAMVKDTQQLDVTLAASGCAVASDSDEYTAATAKFQKLTTLRLALEQEEQTARNLHQQLAWIAIHESRLSHQQMEAATTAIQHLGQQNTVRLAELKQEIKQCEEQLAAQAKVHGPCEASLDKVLQDNSICRQRYHGGSFIGNHVNRALQPRVIAALVAAPCTVVLQRSSPQAILDDATKISMRYSQLLTQFARCSNTYSSCKPLSAADIAKFSSDVAAFMKTARTEIVARKLGYVTPKLHLLEAHTADFLARFRIGLGLLAEQGGESLHAAFNDLHRTHNGISNSVERLRACMMAHLSSTIPQQVALAPKKRTRKSQ